MDTRGPEALEQVVGHGTPQRFGSFRFFFSGEQWEWSDEVARMHGYDPGSVTPTTALIMSHKHPDDVPAVAEKVRRMLATGAPFSSRHRIIDTGGTIHHIIVVADRLYAEAGQVVGSEGFYIDITDTIESEVRSSLSGVMPEFADSREVIDQAKGILMFVYGVSAQRAFDILRWRSQEANVKLREIATQLISEVEAEAGELVRRDTREKFDHILLTVHQRVGASPPLRADAVQRR